MHWIFVGIMIWIGLALAPVVIEIAIFLLPGIFFGFIAALIGVAVTGTIGGFVGGAIIGAIAPYFLMIWHK